MVAVVALYRWKRGAPFKSVEDRRPSLLRVLLRNLGVQHALELVVAEPHERLAVHEELRCLAHAERASVCEVLLDDLDELRVLRVAADSIDVDAGPRQKLPDLLGLRMMGCVSYITCKVSQKRSCSAAASRIFTMVSEPW